MKLQERDGLLFVSLTITHQGVTQSVENVVLDTGAAHSLLNMDSLNIEADPATDEFVFMSGIGGREAALRKHVDAVQFDTFIIPSYTLDFGFFDEHPEINGLLGSDILIQGRFIIDLDSMEIYQRTS